jgi:hypothetical protein
MSIFTDSNVISGENFSHALSPYDPTITESSEFTPSRTLSVVVGEDGQVNIAKTLLSHSKKDPVNCTEVPTFSKGNKFILGIEKALSPIPAGGIILYSQGESFRGPKDSLPQGFVLCDGTIYTTQEGGYWRTPLLPNLDTAAYIQKLPSNVTLAQTIFGLAPTIRR